MLLSFSLFLSGANLRNRKFRSVLTIGGMAVGVALIVFLVSLGFGLQRLIRSQITNAEALTVLDVSKGESTLLQLNEDVVGKFQSFEHVSSVSASISLSGQIARDESVTDVAIYGIGPQFTELEGIKVSSGKPFSSEEAKEVILTTTTLNLIGLEEGPQAIGAPVTLKVFIPKKVEGSQEEELVQQDLEMTITGIIQDEELSIVYVPLKYLQSLGFPADYTEAKVKVSDLDKKLKDYSVARVKVDDQAKLPEVRKKIEEMGYQVDSIADTVGQIDKIFLVFQFIVGGFGAIAMFVAALGALNTLTVSLLERTREIGLMRALGATSSDIYRLFLSEAILIGMTGGVLGIGIGIGSGQLLSSGLRYLARRLGGQPVDIFYTPVEFILVMLVVVILISIVTGFYPARRGATINALDALRYE